MKKAPDCILKGIMASQSPVCVIFRKGPYRLVQVIKWYTDTDRFEEGQWLAGQIDPHTVHLSPNGQLMVYNAESPEYRIHQRRTSNPMAWTAVSKPPYLTALSIWFFDDCQYNHTDHCGSFVSNKLLKIDLAGRLLKPDREISRGKHKPTIEALDGQDSTYLERSEGWETLSQLICPEKGVPYRVHSKQKKVGLITLTLIKGRRDGISNNRYTTEPPIGPAFKKTDWADFDQSGRLIFAQNGKLFGARLIDHNWQIKELADFRLNKFEEVVAPDWAQVW
jgi:hypothetical protein